VSCIGAVNDEQKNGGGGGVSDAHRLEEPFGIVMAEAMACGTPVIGFPRGSVPDIVREGERLLSRTVDSAAAVQKIHRIIDGPCAPLRNA
jgi:glycosyltransferase involved in cell wall biosynthesis